MRSLHLRKVETGVPRLQKDQGEESKRPEQGSLFPKKAGASTTEGHCLEAGPAVSTLHQHQAPRARAQTWGETAGKGSLETHSLQEKLSKNWVERGSE